MKWFLITVWLIKVHYGEQGLIKESCVPLVSSSLCPLGGGRETNLNLGRQTREYRSIAENVMQVWRSHFVPCSWSLIVVLDLGWPNDGLDPRSASAYHKSGQLPGAKSFGRVTAIDLPSVQSLARHHHACSLLHALPIFTEKGSAGNCEHRY